MAKIKHIEIAGVDGGRLESFYRDLFGWEITRRKVGGFDYSDIQLPKGLDAPTAGIRHEPEGQPEIVVYVEVADLKESVKKAEATGRAVRIPPMEHGDLYFALVEDPEGNPIGLIQERPTSKAR